MTKTKHSWPVQLLLLACLLVCIVLAACVGKYPVSPVESLKIMLASLFGKAGSTNEMTVNVVLGLRVPRILASADSVWGKRPLWHRLPRWGTGAI